MTGVIWMVVLTFSTCVIILSAALGQPSLLMAMSAGVSFGIALMAIREIRAIEAAGGSRRVLNSVVARFMGLVWTWGALGLVVSYGLILSDTWPEWWMYFLSFAGAAVLCLLYSSTLERDEAQGKKDDATVDLGRPIFILQLVGMLGTMIWLAVSPSMNLLSAASPDWVANNIFFGGAIALTAISAYALLQDKITDPEKHAPAAA